MDSRPPEHVANQSVCALDCRSRSVFEKEPTLGRNIKMFLCQRYTGEKLKDIAVHFGIGESGVSKTSRRVNDKIQSDKKLGRTIRKIEKN